MLRYYLVGCFIFVFLSSKRLKSESSPGDDYSAGQESVLGEESVPGQESVLGEESVPGQESVPGEESVPGQVSVPGEEAVPGQEPVPGDESVPGQEPVLEQKLILGKERVIGEESVPGQESSSEQDLRIERFKLLQSFITLAVDIFIWYFIVYFVVGVVLVTFIFLIDCSGLRRPFSFALYKQTLYIVAIFMTLFCIPWAAIHTCIYFLLCCYNPAFSVAYIFVFLPYVSHICNRMVQVLSMLVIVFWYIGVPCSLWQPILWYAYYFLCELVWGFAPVYNINSPHNLLSCQVPFWLIFVIFYFICFVIYFY